MEQKRQSKFTRRLLHSGLTLLVLAAVLAVNIGFTVLSDSQLLRLDMSGASYNEISNESRTLLDQLDPDENNITIYFLADADELRSGDALLTFSTISKGSYLMAAGTTMLAHTNYTDRAEYVNREVLVAALSLMSDDNSAYALDDKVIPNEGLNITTAEATRWTVLLAVAMPAVFTVIGLVVNIRRRYS